MRKFVSIGLALAVAMALLLAAVPAMAQEVGTSVSVQGGATAPPIIKCKWEQDITSSLEDGDPTHAVPGAQFLPPLVYGGTKMVQYWVVVTDPEGVDTVTQVAVDVYHPLGPPENGSWKYQLILEKVDKFEAGIPGFVHADDLDLITYQEGYDYDDVIYELEKCTADVYMVQETLSYHQPAGDYRVAANAMDNSGGWASENGTDLENFFTYVPVCGIEIDFTAVSYGTVSVCFNKWIAGDTVFDDPAGIAPVDNPATVRNVGNTDAYITVEQDDMNFSYSGPPENKDWNVEFDARLGSDPANEVVYEPFEWVTLPNVLPLCNTEELDFSIHVKKSISGEHTGYMTVGCLEAF
jgi:hypothetical protein